VILGCDPLLQPLTGIGQYTKQLASGYLQRNEFEAFKLFAHGSFFDNGVVNQHEKDAVKPTKSEELIMSFRQSLAKSRLMVRGYQLVMPFLCKRALKNYQDYVFHSPNFVLPPFDGYKVATIHDLSTIKFSEFHPAARVDFVNKALEESINQADHLITVRNVVKQELISTFGVDDKKVTAIHLGADNSFKPRTEIETKLTLEKYNLSFRGYFLFVSTIEPRKNLNNLLEAYESYRKTVKSPKPMVIVGGGGWNNAEIHDKIKSLSDKGWVQYLGYIPQQDIPQLYSGAQGLLFPSVYEGFGLPALEAMQSGIPVLTSLNTSMHEITQGNAVLVEPLDIGAIAKGISTLDQDEQNRKQLISKGLSIASEYSWQRCVEQTLNTYTKS